MNTTAAGWESLNAFGVWLFNGSTWFPDPTFPGAATCPGSKILWAGKLDYWLVGPGLSDNGVSSPQTLCRFDGVNFQWEVLKLPQGTLDRLPQNPASLKPQGGVNAGACYAWNNCWFFGDSGIVVHWDGSVLTDASGGLGPSPWLQGKFTDAVATTDPSGNMVGLATTQTNQSAFVTHLGKPVPLPRRPDGSPPAQLFRSTGGPYSPLSFSPPATPFPGDPFTTDLVAVDINAVGVGWVAGVPAARSSTTTQGAPLLRIDSEGDPVPCAGYDAMTFPADSYALSSLAVSPSDGSAFAAGDGSVPSGITNVGPQEPVIVHAACGRAPAVTRFRMPDPRVVDQSSAPLIPAGSGSCGRCETAAAAGLASAVAVNAPNDAWAATSFGLLVIGQGANARTSAERPHLYRYADGQPPAAPAGNDYEPRPSLFVPDPPFYVQPPPTVITTPVVVTTSTKPGKARHKQRPSAIYDVKSVVRRVGKKLILYLTFRVRYATTVGVIALHGKKVVSRSRIERFTGHRGQFAIPVDPKHYPTKISFVSPGGKRK